MINLTEDGNYKLYGDQACLVGITGEIHNQVICLYYISGEHSDPSCASKGVFTSSAVQTLVSYLNSN